MYKINKLTPDLRNQQKWKKPTKKCENNCRWQKSKSCLVMHQRLRH